MRNGGAPAGSGEDEGTAGRQAGRRLDEGQGGYPGQRGRSAGEESARADPPDPEEAPPAPPPSWSLAPVYSTPQPPAPTPSPALPYPPSTQQAEVFGKLKLTRHLPEALKRSSLNSDCGHTMRRACVGGTQARFSQGLQAVQAHL